MYIVLGVVVVAFFYISSVKDAKIATCKKFAEEAVKIMDTFRGNSAALYLFPDSQDRAAGKLALIELHAEGFCHSYVIDEYFCDKNRKYTEEEISFLRDVLPRDRFNLNYQIPSYSWDSFMEKNRKFL